MVLICASPITSDAAYLSMCLLAGLVLELPADHRQREEEISESHQYSRSLLCTHRTEETNGHFASSFPGGRGRQALREEIVFSLTGWCGAHIWGSGDVNGGQGLGLRLAWRAFKLQAIHRPIRLVCISVPRLHRLYKGANNTAYLED